MMMYVTYRYFHEQKRKRKEKSLIFFHQKIEHPNEKKNICFEILDSLITRILNILHTTHWEHAYDPSKCVYNDDFDDDDNEQGQHCSKIVQFTYISIFIQLFLVLVLYHFILYFFFIYIWTERIRYTAALFVHLFDYFAQLPFQQDIQICFKKRKKNVRNFSNDGFDSRLCWLIILLVLFFISNDGPVLLAFAMKHDLRVGKNRMHCIKFKIYKH